MGEPRISLVIPAYNEEKLLPRLLDTVDAARRRFEKTPGDVEVVVADNDSTDRTAAIAAARGCAVAHTAHRAIAAARNAGARAARGRILAFTDADMQIHPWTFGAIEASLDTGRIVAGMTGVTMERWSVGIAVTYALMVPMIWATGFDTGVVFCRREDFDAVGGYDETLKVAEDVKFLYALKRHGRKTGRSLKRARGVKAIASARKFDDHGEWHYLRFLFLGPLYFTGSRRAQEIVHRYFYRPSR